MKKYFYLSISIALAVLSVFVFNPVTFANAAGEIDAYCAVPTEAVAHGSTVTLAIKFSDSDKSNDFIVQGPFKVLQYKDKVPVVVDFKRGNEKDAAGKENTDKPTLAFSVELRPKHKMPAPATEEITLTYFVKHKEGKRGSLHTTEREQQVDCSFTVQHEIEKGTTPSGANIKNWTSADLGIENVGTLPTSKWYFLKEWKRGISRLFTFNATARAELELEITNEKAAEVILVEESAPKNTEALAKAFANYTDAAVRLEARLSELKETSENPNVEKLLKRLDEQTLKHSLLLAEITNRWNSDPYVEDANVTNPSVARDNHLQGAVDVMQKKIQEVAVIAAEKDKHIKEKADEQIKRAEEALALLKTRIDSTPARISTNLTVERQTPKTDFGDRMKAGLDTAAGAVANAKTAYNEGKFGEAFGQARSAEVLARNTLRLIDTVLRADTGGLEDEAKNIPPPVINRPIEKRPGDTTKPSACGAIRCFRYDPVCGSDGKTYACGAADASSCGVKVAYEGECKIAPPTEVKPAEGDNCLRESKRCPDGSSVPWTGRNCDIAVCPDQKIQPIEGVSCTQEYDPVCGADGKTYGNGCMARISGASVAYKGECMPTPAVNDIGGYTFEIIGSVHDATDAPAMTSGIPVGGIVIHTVGPKIVTTKTRADGSYTLSFVNAPMGTYDVCVTLPSGYTMNPPSGCETVLVRPSEQYVKTLELINNGHSALHGTVILFTLLRK